MIQDWSIVTIEALQQSWQIFLGFIPRLLGSLIIFIIGWFIAIGIGRLVAEILIRLKFNKLFERTGWKDALAKAEIDVNPSEFVGAIVKWILVIAFLLPAVEILGLYEFAGFLRSLVSWLPNLILAVVIFVVAIIVADIVEKIVKTSLRKIGIGYADLLGAVLRWAIYVFAVLAVLMQIGIASAIIQTLVVGVVAMLVLSFGLAFGLGGRDAAAQIIEDLKRKISEK